MQLVGWKRFRPLVFAHLANSKLRCVDCCSPKIGNCAVLRRGRCGQRAAVSSFSGLLLRSGTSSPFPLQSETSPVIGIDPALLPGYVQLGGAQSGRRAQVLL